MTPFATKRGCRRAGLTPTFAGIIAVMFLFLFLSSGGAVAQDLFVVEDVPVDVTADTAAEARDRAIEQAARKAFDQLTERLAFEPGFGPAPSVSDAMVLNLVEGIEFDNEKSSAVRYLADITVRFRSYAVRELYNRDSMDAYGSAAVDRPTLLVIPVYEMAGARVIWEEFNPWWVAWEQRVGQSRRMRLMLPEGDSDDVVTLTPQQAATGDRGRILALADDYNASGALVARATVDRSGAAPALDLVVTSFGGVPSGMGLVDRVSGAPGEGIDAVSRRGVARILDMIDNVTRGRPVASAYRTTGPATASTIVTAELDSLADLTAIRRKIGAIVERDELVSLSRGKATLRLFHAGNRAALRRSLSRGGIVVTDAPEGWTLTLPGSAGRNPAGRGSTGTYLTPRLPASSGGR